MLYEVIFLNCGYIKQIDIPTQLIDKIKYFLNIIEIKKYEEGFVIKLPINSNCKIKKIEKVMKKVFRKIQKYKIETLIFSEQLSRKNKERNKF